MADGRRGDVDHSLERGLAQQRERGAGGAHHREHAEVELVEPGGVGQVVEPAHVRGADGVDEHVALAPPLVEEGERRFDLAGVEQIALEADGILGSGGQELVLGFAQVGRGAGEHRDPAAFGGEQLRGGAPDTTRAARDHRGTAAQAEVHQAASCRARWRALRGSPVARITSSSHRRDAPGANTSRTSNSPAARWSTRPPAPRGWRRAATRTARRTGSSGSRRAPPRGGSWRPSPVRGGRRVVARCW